MLFRWKIRSYYVRHKIYFQRYQHIIDRVREHDCGDKTQCVQCMTDVYILGRASQEMGIDPDAEADRMYEQAGLYE